MAANLVRACFPAKSRENARFQTWRGSFESAVPGLSSGLFCVRNAWWERRRRPEQYACTCWFRRSAKIARWLVWWISSESPKRDGVGDTGRVLNESRDRRRQPETPVGNRRRVPVPKMDHHKRVRVRSEGTRRDVQTHPAAYKTSRRNVGDSQNGPRKPAGVVAQKHSLTDMAGVVRKARAGTFVQ
jgi:hypothetical protein